MYQCDDFGAILIFVRSSISCGYRFSFLRDRHFRAKNIFRAVVIILCDHHFSCDSHFCAIVVSDFRAIIVFVRSFLCDCHVRAVIIFVQ